MAVEQKHIENLLSEKLDELDCFLVEVDINATQKKVVVYIDGDNGVTIDQCASVSRFLHFHLDHEGEVWNSYTLDVSSPGMDRPFKLQRQYNSSIGKEIEVELLEGGAKVGRLDAVEENGILLSEEIPAKQKHRKPEFSEVSIPFSEIKFTKRSLPSRWRKK